MATVQKLAEVPPVVVASTATVQAAVEAMIENGVDAVSVVDGGRLKGLFTERDLMAKVVLRRLDPVTTKMVDVCTTTLWTVPVETTDGQALRLMVERRIRHLPIVDRQGALLGMLSMRDLLKHRVEELSVQLDSLEAYIGADGPGG